MRRFAVRPTWALSLLCCALVVGAAPVGAQTAKPPEPTRIEAAARRIVAGAVVATFVTLDSAGAPRTRQVQPLLPDSTWTVWFATNPRTRKVNEIARDGRVVLHYFDPKLAGYVSLIGRARVVRDRRATNAHWTPEWNAFYADRDTSVALIAVTAERLEVVCVALGIEGDKGTWLPPTVRVPRRR